MHTTHCTTSPPPRTTPHRGHHPAWFNEQFKEPTSDVGSKGTTPLLVSNTSDTAPRTAAVEEKETCCDALRYYCCTFRTALVPLLLIITLLGLFAFVMRLVLNCK